MPEVITTSRNRLPTLPGRAQIATVGRYATRYPESAWLDMLALRATSGRQDAAMLIAAPTTVTSQARVDALVEFAFVLAACADDSETLRAVAELFATAMRIDPEHRLDQRAAGVWLQALHLSGTLENATLKPSPDSVSEETLWGVDTDRANPFVPRSETLQPEDVPRWLELLSTPFTSQGRRPLTLHDGAGAPFDRLAAPGLPQVDGPLVSIVVPVYNPPASLLTAVHSLLQQTWANIEVLICDDGSVSGLQHLTACAEIDDSRLRMIQSQTNQGTYVAFNRGLAHAHGEYVTFQGADDYSHPQRIEAHMDGHLSAAGPIATISLAVRASAQLEVTSVGTRLTPTNASSFMFERELVLERLGGYDTVRKAADSEFTNRFVAAFGSEKLLRMDDTLAVIQATPNSVSRGELGFLRRHPARQAYRAAADAWHDRIRDGASAIVTPGERAPFPAPAHFTGDAIAVPELSDVAVLTSVTCEAPSRSSAMLAALTEGEATVTVLEFVSTQDVVVPSPGRTDPDFARMLSDGVLRWALPGEHARGTFALVEDPEALVTMPVDSLQLLEAGALVVAFDIQHAPLLPAVQERLHVLPHLQPAWLPASTAAAARLRAMGSTFEVLDPARWWVAAPPSDPLGGNDRAIVGMISSRFTSLAANDVRPRSCLPRDAETPLWSWGPSPARLVSRPVHRVRTSDSWRDFIRQVDYFVAPTTPQVSTLVMDAWSVGTTVLAADAMRSVLRDRALYPGDEGADLVIANSDSALHAHTVAAGTAWARSHTSPEALRATYQAIRDQLRL